MSSMARILRMFLFLSTPSARRATGNEGNGGNAVNNFYPRPPRGGRLANLGEQAILKKISIHALREEGDENDTGPWAQTQISIHALREEGDLENIANKERQNLFLSTPSARRATKDRDIAHYTVVISIHALREEGDDNRHGRKARALYFYPRPPRGGRLWFTASFVPLLLFLSTPSARRATAKTETKSLFSYKLYNILHEFRRALIYNGSKNYPNHAKRLKNPVRRCRKNAENSPFAPGRETQNNSRPSCSKGG